jgi:hypothetical protein
MVGVLLVLVPFYVVLANAKAVVEVRWLGPNNPTPTREGTVLSCLYLHYLSHIFLSRRTELLNYCLTRLMNFPGFPSLSLNICPVSETQTTSPSRVSFHILCESVASFTGSSGDS